jgi:hypothetical protein
METSEIGQYPCSKLLREMEAVDLDVEEEDLIIINDDDELVRLPES